MLIDYIYELIISLNNFSFILTLVLGYIAIRIATHISNKRKKEAMEQINIINKKIDKQTEQIFNWLNQTQEVKPKRRVENIVKSGYSIQGTRKSRIKYDLKKLSSKIVKKIIGIDFME